MEGPRPPPLHPRGHLPRLAPAPRAVPTSLRVRLLFGGLGVFAWLWLGMGASLAAYLLRHADLTSWALFAGDVRTAVGEVTGCVATRASEGGGKGSTGRRIYRTDFRFDAEGAAWSGGSYSTACARMGPVEVEYPAGRPGLARVAGMRRAPFGPKTAVVLLFPVIGLALVGGTLRQGSRQVALLRRGRLALGALAGKEATGAAVNDRRVMRLRFSVRTEAGAPLEVAVRTTHPEVLEDEPRERILYDPADPRRAAAWDLLPGRPEVDQAGELRAAGSARALALLLVPLGALAAIALALAAGP